MIVRIYLTGAVCVESGPILVTEDRLPGPQGRIVLAMLAAEHRRPVGRDELVAELWGDSPPSAPDAAIRAIVSKVRSALAVAGIDGASLAHAFGAYQLKLPKDAWVDIEAADDAIHRAETALRDENPSDAVGWGRVAVNVAARPLLIGSNGPWVTERRERLRQIRLRALECLAGAWLATGDAAQATRDAEDALRLDEFREASHRLLMRSLAAAGDRAGALRAYQRCREALADELGVDPSPETESLYLEILKLE